MSTLLQVNFNLRCITEFKDYYPEYKKQLLFLDNYAAQVKTYRLPQLVDPSTWPGGKDAYTKADITWRDTASKLKAWSDSTLVDIRSLPIKLIKHSNESIIPNIDADKKICQILIRDPSNKLAKDDLLNHLNLLSIDFDERSKEITELISDLESESTVFDDNAKIMQNIVNDAMNTSGVDKKKIDDLSAEITKLNDDIYSATWGIIGGAVATLAGIGMCIAGIVLTIPTGGVSLTLLIPGIVILGGGATCVALNSIEIIEDKQLIENDSKAIDNYNLDIVTLDLMSKELNKFSSQLDKLKNALSVVCKPWINARDYFKNAISEINSIETMNPEDWQKVSDELNDISDNWNTIIEIMNEIKLDNYVCKTNLSIGMSAEDVKKAIDGSDKVSIESYLAL